MSDLFPGSTIAGCRLESVAGRGGMGVVYRATQLALGRPVALKAIAPELAADDVFRERFQRESHLAASIEHPNVIPVYEAGELDGTLFLIMRWVEGTDLRAMLRISGKLEPDRALELLRPVASALAAAHRRGLMHRDIKPANVLIATGDEEDEEHVYLTDFGIARRMDTRHGVTRTGVMVGTIDYLAPERINGGRGTPASDIYAFGCMLFEALTGHIPFARPTDVAKMYAHMSDPVPSAAAEVSHVSPQLDGIIAKAMAKEPEDRFASAGELSAALNNVVATDGFGETRISPGATDSEALLPPTQLHTPTTASSPGSSVPSETPATPATPANAATPATPATPAAAAAPPPLPPPPPPPAAVAHKKRSRGPLLVAIGAIVAAVIVIVIVASSGGGGGGGAGSPLQSTTGALALGHTVDLGAEPTAIATDLSGNVWASLTADGKVALIDSATGSVKQLDVHGSPRLLASTKNGVWVSGSGSGGATLARLDVGQSTPVATATLPSPPVALAADRGDGSVFAAEPNGTIIHLDSSGHPAAGTAKLTPAPGAMGVGEGWLWAVGGVPLTRIGTGDTPSVTPFPVVPKPIAVTFDNGVWTANANGHVSKFDPRTQYLRVRADHEVASDLNAIAGVERGAFVWASSRDEKTVYAISANGDGAPSATAVFKSVPVGLAASGGSVWVATSDGHVTQISP